MKIEINYIYFKNTLLVLWELEYITLVLTFFFDVFFEVVIVLEDHKFPELLLPELDFDICLVRGVKILLLYIFINLFLY